MKKSVLSWGLPAELVSREQFPEYGVEVFDRLGVSELVDDVLGRESPRGQIYRLVGIDGSEFAPKERSNGNVLKLALSRGYRIPPAQAAIAMATRLSKDDQEDAHFVVMHEPEHTLPNNLVRLYIVIRDGQRYIDTCSPFDSDVRVMEDDIVFVFLAP